MTGLSVLEDQALSGIIMWIPGSMMYIIAALILLFNFMRQEERRNEAERRIWVRIKGHFSSCKLHGTFAGCHNTIPGPDTAYRGGPGTQ
ncbi:MAG: cytochrome c oxidase assembly protein [Chloroflexi bacterium]|nr:cytochrome c oxidase assembly protein [Chloroflexota bacterium]